MPSPAPVLRGVRELHRLLREHTCDVRSLDVAGFRDWLSQQLTRWRRDPVFAQRTRIRDLRRAHPRLRALEQAQRRAADADAATPQFARLARLEQELTDTAKAIAGLTAALQQGVPERRAALEQKLEGFQARRQALQEEQAQLLGLSPERQTLLNLSAELQQLRVATGLDREEACLGQLLREKGRRSGRSGASFERLALTLTEGHVVPDFLRDGGRDEAGRLRVLRGVTLGAAGIEFDLLVVERPPQDRQAVEVLAVVEAKRNPNDLAHGFRRRQADLAWLTGDTARYDPSVYRTRYFPSGHFDQEVVHRDDEEAFVFAPGSFRHFARAPETGWFVDRLYFVTRAATLWGLSAAALTRIGFRVARDERWEPESDAYLGRLLPWCQSLTEPIETPDVLQLYASAPGWGRQVLVVSR